MKIFIKHLHHAPSRSFIELLEGEITALSTEMQIDEAHAIVERRLQGSPPFHVAFHLVTPGPDITAAAADHTLRAALLKAVGLLREKIHHRHSKRVERRAQGGVKKVAPQHFGSSGARH